jgi:hypothetical protein
MAHFKGTLLICPGWGANPDAIFLVTYDPSMNEL